jgi:hypothetical protein
MNAINDIPIKIAYSTCEANGIHRNNSKAYGKKKYSKLPKGFKFRNDEE